MYYFLRKNIKQIKVTKKRVPKSNRTIPIRSFTNINRSIQRKSYNPFNTFLSGKMCFLSWLKYTENLRLKLYNDKYNNIPFYDSSSSNSYSKNRSDKYQIENRIYNSRADLEIDEIN